MWLNSGKVCSVYGQTERSMLQQTLTKLTELNYDKAEHKTPPFAQR